MFRIVGPATLMLLALGLVACSSTSVPASATANPGVSPSSIPSVSPTPVTSPSTSPTPATSPTPMASSSPSSSPSVSPSASPTGSSGALGTVADALTGKGFACGSAAGTTSCQLIGPDGITYQVAISGTDQSPIVVFKASGKNAQQLAASNMPGLIGLVSYSMGGTYAQVQQYFQSNLTGSGSTIVFGNTHLKIERTPNSLSVTLSLSA